MGRGETHTSAAFVVRPMTEVDALAVAGWRYPEQYAFYNADADPADLAELLDPAEWGLRYFAVDGDDHQLAGFFVFKPAGEDVEIGLGLRPELTGDGLGGAFIEAGLQFAEQRFAARSFSLAVATFNTRAITVYCRAGFRVVQSYQHETNGGVHSFVRMTRGPILPHN